MATSLSVFYPPGNALTDGGLTTMMAPHPWELLMRTLICLIAACTALACTSQGQKEPETPKTKAPELSQAEAEARAKAEAEKKAKAEAKAKAKAEKEKAEAERRASWTRTPQKKVPPPKDVKRPAKKGTKTTMAGVKYRVLKAGSGQDNPKLSSQVTIHYTGWTTNGRMFDSTMKTGEPATFGLSGLIDGWKDVIQYMVVGESIRAWIPEKLAYKGKPGRPAGTLVFDIELLDFK